MNFLQWLLGWLFPVPAAEPPLQQPTVPQEAPIPPTPPIAPPESVYNWSTQKGAYHLVRQICDASGLTLEEKNIICACIFQESRFLNTATNKNYHADGTFGSTDWGIFQINDRFHIGPGKDFPSVPFVLNNPDKVVQWMVKMFKLGHLSEWVSFSSGAYKQWLLPNSPMWKLGK